ncbi:DUF6688 family protein [Dysgonomonas sp. 25]|uniref:DUF6688 domain-containing protein n=1 Tax=Dysgonomonas sp. 25 TaxID=2302933 RepID=UPI0013D27F51|nr:DUF6688 family protein [Dysgonomonas sp. 25]NDV70127.1 hypothetical protein [Dysgonomonas sp. 25]
MELLLLPLSVIILVSWGIMSGHKHKSLGMRLTEILCILAYLFSFGLLLLTFLFSDAEYHEAIDPVERGYTPFALTHRATLIVFYILSIISALLLWLKGRNMPPLLFVLSMVFLLIGIGISVVAAIHLSEKSGYNDLTGIEYSVSNPIIYIILSIALIVKVVREVAEETEARSYNNKILDRLNKLMADTKRQPLWIVGLLFPVFALVVIILMLFGQEADSIVKVFTETSTWRLSQMEHPPYLDHQGHYLCTVAACGHPSVVRPMRLGKRHNRTIIVNRQLMIANAFEEKIAEIAPFFHTFIRRNYDKYGYPVSKHINTPLRSSIVYFVMKPLEWVFLVTLYLSDIHPEKRISRQYSQ